MKENEQKILVAGVDGSKGGWVCVSGNLNSNDNTKLVIFNNRRFKINFFINTIAF